VSEVQEFAVAIPEGVQMPTLPGESFSELIGDGSLLNGWTDSRELMKVKHDLTGTPFVVTSITFRPGTSPDKGKTLGDYVSVEAVTFENRRVVFNDSSTGIRRQLVIWLCHMGAVADPKVKENPDLTYQYWDSDKLPTGVWAGKTGQETLKFEAVGTGEPIRFLARHGLRASEYLIPKEQGGNGKDTATTFYLD
jgi:hypothetical protein